MHVLIITAVEEEARAIGAPAGTTVVVGGIGRTNAACATTETLLARRDVDLVLSAGVAGALPRGGLEVGDAIVASSCVYVEEGLLSAHGFSDVSSIGLELGDFPGNAVPVDARALERLTERFPIGPIATVATCSGTDEQAALVVRRTGAVAEAMEGAAVVHAARRRRIGGIELRTISNRTGDRAAQGWDLPRALDRLGEAVRNAVAAMSA